MSAATGRRGAGARRRLLGPFVVGLLVLLAACTGGRSTTSPEPTSPPPTSPSGSSSGSSSGSPSGSPAGGPHRVASRPVTKLLVFVEENHALNQMREQMPYAFGLARQYGYATDYHALSHPSLPNYIQIAGGDSHGVNDNGDPSQYPVDGTSVFGQAIAAGRTAAVFADGMPENCATSDGGNDYVVHHNPWVYFTAERSDCQRYDQPASGLDAAIAHGRLPNAGMVIPNQCHNAHDCDLSVADAWFAGYMRKIFAGPDWRSGHLAVVLTADEDDDHHDNAVLTVVIHPSQHGHVVNERLDHYSLTRLYEDVVHAPHLLQAADATSMSEAFGLPIG